MKQSARTSSTQHFTEILDIREDIVLLRGGNACLVISIQAVNFALLSKDEQDAKVYAYAALLNSLSFPIQIVVRSKKIEIMPYLASLDDAAKKTTNQKLAASIAKYRQFVEQLISVTSVLDKEFFIVISYSSIESGSAGVGELTGIRKEATEDFFTKASAALHTKADVLLSQIDRMALRAKVLEKDGLVGLFHDIYNEQGLTPHDIADHAVSATKGVTS